MSGNAQLFERYKKSDIFNVNEDEEALQKEIKPRRLNRQASFINTQADIFHTLETEPSSTIDKPNTKRNYVLRHHKSDIFNLKDILYTPKRPTLKKNRNANNYSNCFESMKDNEQFKTEIKEYTTKHRAQKKVYNPDKYFVNEDPSERVYNNLYDRKRNPILPNKHSNMMKSSTNLFSNINLNDKKLFTERKKRMTNQFTNPALTQMNKTERKKLAEENEKGIKTHKFYKSKGFTYNDNNYRTENNFYLPGQNPANPGNNSKINKQMELQSNIFGQNKNNDINKIKERIKKAEENDEEREKPNAKKKVSYKKVIESEDNDRNIWGSLHSNWEKSNLDWRDPNTELLFGKTYSGPFPKIKLEKKKEKEKEDAFARKVKHLSDSGFKDTINEQESIKSKRMWKKFPMTHSLTYSNLEQIDEVLNEIPDEVLRPDRKKKIIGNADTTDFSGNVGIGDTFINYKKYHKKILNKDENKNKDPKIKIMSREENKKKKVIPKTATNLKMHDDYNVHDFILSYDSKIKSNKTNLDSFNEKDIKLIFSKKGLHIYDINRNHFDNGKYNTITFKIRENEGDNALNEKIKNVENDFNKKQYKVNIKKDVEKSKKVNFRGIAKNPFSKGLIVAEDKNKKNNEIEKKTLRKNASFSGTFSLINHKYKK
jgi:hypothetical protein